MTCYISYLCVFKAKEILFKKFLEKRVNMEFKNLNIIEPILKELEKKGYVEPTPIQKQTIPLALEGHDILGLAQTGTGKTASFAIPTLQLLLKKGVHGKKRKIRALVLTPTRELACQIHDNFNAYGKALNLKSSVIFGGVKQFHQVKELNAGVDILIATPGRLLDLIKQGYISLDALEVFILDEADRMLDMGFINDIKSVLKLLPKQKQTMLFSATMPKEIMTIADELLNNPKKVAVTPVSSTVDRITQSVYYVDQKNKINLLSTFLKNNPNEGVLVFTETKHGANRVVKELDKLNIKAAAIHGNKSQVARQNALENFKNSNIKALVATDIASRGIDINELKYVVNYDLPNIPETYVHRIGRTGRAGNVGEAISYCNFHEIEYLKDIEKLIKQKISVSENTKYPLIDKTEKPKKRQRSSSNNSSKNNKNSKDSNFATSKKPFSSKGKAKNSNVNSQNKKARNSTSRHK